MRMHKTAGLTLGATLGLLTLTGCAASNHTPTPAGPIEASDPAGASSTVASAEGASGGVARARIDLPSPLTITRTAYEKAAEPSLDEVKPVDHVDLHNVYRLSENIISGSEPEGFSGLRKIADMGVKTILSVDGKVPDAETARRLGMRYVHIPIRYRGITGDELLQIAKTFRELEGPFYVHCFHGKHRGPAAAAVGRLILDGAPRDQAIAEMRQWCGTSGKYEGLYRVIATGDIPSAEKTEAYAFSFPETFAFRGFRHSMVEICRTFDNLKALHKNGWAIDPAHPDLDPIHEARQLEQSFRKASELEGMDSEPDDFRAWMAASADSSKDLHERLSATRRARREPGFSADRMATINDAYQAISANCQACHSAYRNDG